MNSNNVSYTPIKMGEKFYYLGVLMICVGYDSIGTIFLHYINGKGEVDLLKIGKDSISAVLAEYNLSHGTHQVDKRN